MNRNPRVSYDIFLVGVGGQGVLAIGELLADAAFRCDMAVSFFPSKGMAQRGGFVKAQLRLGRPKAGPTLPEKGADLVIAMELSEALKAIRMVRPGGDFLVYADMWPTAAVLLGKQSYPAAQSVTAAIETAGARPILIAPGCLPTYAGQPAAPNLYCLGAALAQTPLGGFFPATEVEATLAARWPRRVEANTFAFREGLKA